MRTKKQKENINYSETFESVVERRIERRSFLKGMLGALPVMVVSAGALGKAVETFGRENGKTAVLAENTPSSLTFKPISLDRTDVVKVPQNYVSNTLIRWGDPILPGAPAFDIANQTKQTQSQQFGYNCDFVCYFPLEVTFPLKEGESISQSNRGILTVNHEYVNPELMFNGYSSTAPTVAQIETGLAAHGASIIEIQRGTNGVWTYVQSSNYNRRITGETVMQITGPAAGDDLLKTTADPTGTSVLGMLNNCGGGFTPWGTLLTAEENFNQYFANRNQMLDSDPRKAIHARYGLTTGASELKWETANPRFNLATEPNEAFRFGWVVEIDPYNPNWVPKKRTALGRFKHEAATVTKSLDNRAVVYTGDDERFDYMYKFVSTNQISSNREDNFNILDSGTLHVAKFNDDGTGVWIPLIGGQGPLSGFTQAQVLINTRGAADLVGATRMDRPEDIERNPVNGKVYAAFTNNTLRGTTGQPGTNAANPRAVNRHGHIIEITETDNDAAATTFEWEIFMLCGNPRNMGDRTYFAGLNPVVARRFVSPLSAPDNLSFDASGNLWIATDGMPNNLPGNDGIFAVATEGSERGIVKQFLSSVIACETSSLFIAQDDRTMFVSIQHPGEGSTVAAPTSRFPDYSTSLPPRPSVIAITKTNGSPIIGS